MTVKELAQSMKRNIEEVQEAILYIKDGPDIHPTTRLNEMNIIKDIVKKCGMKMKIVSAPSQNEEKTEERDRDVRKRPPAAPELLKPRPPVVTVSTLFNFTGSRRFII
jgi:translation initiation factor IF-2